MKRQIWFLVLGMGVVMATKVLTFVIGMMFLMMFLIDIREGMEWKSFCLRLFCNVHHTMTILKSNAHLINNILCFCHCWQ